MYCYIYILQKLVRLVIATSLKFIVSKTALIETRRRKSLTLSRAKMALGFIGFRADPTTWWTRMLP